MWKWDILIFQVIVKKPARGKEDRKLIKGLESKPYEERMKDFYLGEKR